MIADAIAVVNDGDAAGLYGPAQISQADPSQGHNDGQDRVARIVDGDPTNQFAAVGIVENIGCTGTLISPTHVLTAGHCTNGTPNTGESFRIGGQSYQTIRLYTHPNYNDNSLANDIAIMELDRPVTGITPEAILRTRPQVGQTLTLVGFGAGGTGQNGHNGDFGTKRVGQTSIERVTAREIEWNFDPGESNTAPGDSGGPAFVTINGQRFIAGVTSGGTRDDAGHGDTSTDMRVDAYADWIDSIVGRVNDPNPDPNPDPSDDHGNQLASATELTLAGGATEIDAVLEQTGDRDFFAVDIADLSDVSIALYSPGEEVDTYLRIYNQNGRLIASNDDSGNSLNSVVDMELDAGRYYISAGGYDDAEQGRYKLSINSQEVPGEEEFDAIGIDLNDRGNGRVNATLQSGEISMFAFQAVRTGRTVIQTSARTRGLDTVMRVFDADGNLVGENDDFGRGLNSRVVFGAVAGETYFVDVAEYNEDGGNFRLVVRNRGTLPARAAHDVAMQDWTDRRYFGLRW